MEENERSPELDLDTLWKCALDETNPQTRAVLWGKCVCHVLSLEDIREGLSFEEIRRMSDQEANMLADHMHAVLEMRSSWQDGVPTPGTCDVDPMEDQGAIPCQSNSRIANMTKRVEWPKQVATKILTKCHWRCCVCPEHRRIADIHHIDGDSSNSIEANGVALCKLCHVDAHTTSTMQRNLHPDHLIEFKKNWEDVCEKIAFSLVEDSCAISNAYYMNVHRLDSLLRELGEDSVVAGMPHVPSNQTGAYHTLWANSKNPLNWTQLLENRNYFEARLKSAIVRLSLLELSLFEVEALDVKEHVGGLISFNCQFVGHDIPDQTELVENDGQIDGPHPTMRREIRDTTSGHVRETCMMLDTLYMYSDSSFVQFSEDGIWSGIARLTKYREAVGSNDGHLLRNQLILTPICIGTPARSIRMPLAQTGKDDPDRQYLEILKHSQVDQEQPSEVNPPASEGSSRPAEA